MEGEIINRVANSKLKTIDLEDYYPAGQRSLLDISQWLLEGLVLIESRFRESINNTDFTVYKDHYVAIHCSTDAIVPQWAWMLIQVKLTGIAKVVIVGDLEQLETLIYKGIIDRMDIDSYKNLPVIIKGCSHKPVPVSAYIMLTAKLQPLARRVLYGEACSSVPVFKKSKK